MEFRKVTLSFGISSKSKKQFQRSKNNSNNKNSIKNSFKKTIPKNNIRLSKKSVLE
jgi:hypothetical protein